MPADRKSFDRVAECYDATRRLPADAEAAIAAGIMRALREVAPLPSVLEVGIGTGRIALPLVAAGAHVVGVDVAPAMLPASATPSISYTRVTTASMPNLVPANNPVEAGFLGDYMWVTVDRDGRPYVVWADTRGMNAAVEEDVYFRPPS